MTTTTRTPILLTGVTGGMGAKILSDLLTIHKYPPADIIATSRRESDRTKFEAQGVKFRVADYDSPDSLTSAFQNVDNLLFMSSSCSVTEDRIVQHQNVIDAAVKAKVKKTWYVSLAFGGWGNESKIFFQEAHYATEVRLGASGLDFVSLRAGIYSDAFPLFLNWYPSSTRVPLPNLNPPVSKGQVAWASRDELSEGIAALLAKGGLDAFPTIEPKTENNIVLLTGAKTENLLDLVDAINRGRGMKIPVEFLEPEVWVEETLKNDEGGKPKIWFQAAVVFMEGCNAGDAETIDPALETLLGRQPETGTQAVERLVRENPGYKWHQNHVKWAGGLQ